MGLERLRRSDARVAASRYAPAPEASAVGYGLIGTALFGVGAWGLTQFYGVPLWSHPALLGSVALVPFAIGVWLRRKRKRRHDRAYRAELGQPPAGRDRHETSAG
jgi:hypothetical protein